MKSSRQESKRSEEDKTHQGHTYRKTCVHLHPQKRNHESVKIPANDKTKGTKKNKGVNFMLRNEENPMEQEQTVTRWSKLEKETSFRFEERKREMGSINQ